MLNPNHRHLLEHIHWEVTPMKNLDKQCTYIPAGQPVSVTCSPVKGIDETLRVTADICALGHPVTPHFAARMLESREHLAKSLARLEKLGVTSLFCIAGDRENPVGPYADSLELIEDVLKLSTSISHIGFGTYPDGHAFISDHVLQSSRMEKQTMIQAAGRIGWSTTQMCFDARAIKNWIEGARSAGFQLPIYLGVAGAVDRKQLMTMGMRLGIGTSLSFLKKNRSTLGKLLGGGYDANQIISTLSADAERLGIAAIHAFTFNQVENTVKWRNATLASAAIDHSV